MTLVICSALSAAGLAIALLTAFRRRFRRATFIAAWSLLPIGFQMTGLLTMLRKIGVAIGDWASGLVMKPTVWSGFAVLAVAVVLFIVARLAGGKGLGFGRKKRRERKAREKEAKAGGRSGVAATAAGPAAPGASKPAGALEGDRSAPQPAARSGKKSASSDDDLSDFSEIEAILKKRGI
ncbi:hypothetical protein BIV57_17655 [Mangrovactinospora gilvigrisea]|uniref:Cellulose synthase n=1 Tax=Mangrovactinospora gilvigrisea TaxID=1428644 RepID=A0A1J7C3Q7_9ACTN|nr:hypothetical protein [Mangrovactinospora gilvigrisea]OIV36184.1 hypothetical protein BIV57_17655 [Mangrovactinospora gilvigrisea]